jgi:hypothetical protein
MAYGSNLSFSDDVTTAPIGGIGGYSFDALEPMQYIARGNFSLMRYGKDAHGRITSLDNSLVPSRASGADSVPYEGNSMLLPSQFNPVQLLLSSTFDIDVFERQGTSAAAELKHAFKIQNCRMTTYALAFNPGSLVAENIGFMCIRVRDKIVDEAAAAPAE